MPLFGYSRADLNQAVLQERRRIANAVVYPYILRGEPLPLTWNITFGKSTLEKAVREQVEAMRARGNPPGGEYAKL